MRNTGTDRRVGLCHCLRMTVFVLHLVQMAFTVYQLLLKVKNCTQEDWPFYRIRHTVRVCLFVFLKQISILQLTVKM